METEIVAPSDAVVDTPPIESDSLADHEAAYTRSTEPAAEVEPEPAKAEKPEDKGRHRAQSQKAGPADVPRINSLTKQLRAAQAELERLKGTTAPAQEARRQEAPVAPRQQSEQTKPSVSLEDFVEKPDVSRPRLSEQQFYEIYPTAPYEMFQDYISSYRQTAADQRRQQEHLTTQRTHVEQHVSDINSERLKQFDADTSAFVATKADFKEKVQALGRLLHVPMPPVMTEIVVDGGPELYYNLVSNPALFAEMHLLSRGLDVTDDNVAIVQRRLGDQLTRTQAAITGSVAAPQRTSAPRPPNPVRTGSLNTGDELPDDKSDSLAAHERAYKPKRR